MTRKQRLKYKKDGKRHIRWFKKAYGNIGLVETCRLLDNSDPIILAKQLKDYNTHNNMRKRMLIKNIRNRECVNYVAEGENRTNIQVRRKNEKKTETKI